MPSIQLFIPEPCHENWDAMTPTDQGRYCQSCAKEVVDFASMSDTEIVNFLKNRPGNLCGNIMTSQLERPIEAARKRSFAWKYFFQFFIPAFMFAQKAKAQGMIRYATPKTEKCANPATPVSAAIPGNIASGMVKDGQTNLPLADVTIKVKGKAAGVRTDAAGMFRLQAAQAFKTIVAEVSCIGYQSSEQVLYGGKENAVILLQPAEVKLDTVVIVANSSYTRGSMRMVGAMSVVSCTLKRSVVRQVVDTITGKNQFKVYPNPVSRNEAVHIDMQKVQPGEYLIRLFNSAGVPVQEDRITVPKQQFIYQLAFRKTMAAGTYTINVISPANKNVYTSRIIVL